MSSFEFWECLRCGHQHDEDFPEAFGSDIECEKCGAIHETEHEEAYDSYCGWVRKLKEPNDDNE